MTSVYAQALVSRDLLAKRLKRTPDGSEVDVWDTALLDASNHLRDVIGQPITAATTTVILDADDAGVVRVPFCPVRSIDAIADRTGRAVLDEGFVASDRQSVHLPAYLAGAQLTVTVSHGWTDVPGEIVRWVVMLAAARIADVDGGTLGMGGPNMVAVDDARIGMDTTGGTTEVPEDARVRLRRNYGGV